MSKLDSEKLIERIEEAKDWLEKAKDEYSKDNPVRGGLILNLAQAEVKHAWELSHHQFVSKSVREPIRKHYPRYWVPVAASLVLIIGLVVGIRMGKKVMKPEQILVKESSERVVRNEAPPVQKVNEEIISQDQQPEVLNSDSAPKVPETQAEKQEKANVQVAAGKSSGPLKKEAPSRPGHKEQEVIPGKSQIKPVSQFSIDEEALTREASHSLRNGK